MTDIRIRYKRKIDRREKKKVGYKKDFSLPVEAATVEATLEMVEPLRVARPESVPVLSTVHVTERGGSDAAADGQ